MKLRSFRTINGDRVMINPKFVAAVIDTKSTTVDSDQKGPTQVLLSNGIVYTVKETMQTVYDDLHL